MSSRVAVAAVDLGATSGRVMLGIVGDGSIALDEAHRFDNRLVERDGHLCWDIDALWSEVRTGISAADAEARARELPGIAAIGIDSWAVDYALVSPDGERIGEVISYRDERTAGAAERVAQRMDSSRQFSVTGIAQQGFNTLYQLAADDRLAAAPPGTQALLVPDYLAFLLTGERRTERTNASTTGMVDARTQDWSPELLAAAGVDATLFAPLIDPGEVIGLVREDIVADLTTASVPVIAVCSHDTASAVLAVPALAEGAGPLAYISSGTWSLVGIELKDPVATESARTAGFTNEGGTPGSVRFLKNVMGMWLLQESRREWAADGLDPGLIALLEDAAREEAGRWRIDATDPAFLAPGQMATRIREVARPEDGADDGPRSPAQVTRCIVDSLAVAYRDTLQEACEIAGVPWPKRLHVVGGGSRNALLNQLTADATGLDVAAGPVEATALGNVAMQAQGLGVLPEGHAALRAVVRGGVELETFRPGGQPRRAMSAG